MAHSNTHAAVVAPYDTQSAAQWNAQHVLTGVIDADGSVPFTGDQPFRANKALFGATDESSIYYSAGTLTLTSDEVGLTGSYIELYTAGSSRVYTRGNHVVVLGDALGANSFLVWDDTLNPVFSVDSQGTAQFFNDIVLPFGVGAVYDAGSCVWDAIYSGQVWYSSATTGVAFGFDASFVTTGAGLAVGATSVTSGYALGAAVNSAICTTGSIFRGFSGLTANTKVFDLDHDGIMWGNTVNSNPRFRRLQHKGCTEMYCDGATAMTQPIGMYPFIYWPLVNTVDKVFFQFHMPADWCSSTDIDVVIRVCLLANEDAGDDIGCVLSYAGKQHCDTLDMTELQGIGQDYDIGANNNQYHVFDIYFSIDPSLGIAPIASDDTLFCMFGLNNLTTPYIDNGVGVISARMWYHSEYAAPVGTLT